MGWTEWLSLLDHGKGKKRGGDRCDDRSADLIASSSKVSSARFEFAGCIEGERKVKGRREGEKKGKVN